MRPSDSDPFPSISPTYNYITTFGAFTYGNLLNAIDEYVEKNGKPSHEFKITAVINGKPVFSKLEGEENKLSREDLGKFVVNFPEQSTWNGLTLTSFKITPIVSLEKYEKKQAEERARIESEEKAKKEAEKKDIFQIKLHSSETITFTKDNLVEAMKDWVKENGMPTHYLEITDVNDFKPIFKELTEDENKLEGTENAGKFAIKTLNGSSFNGQLIPNNLITSGETSTQALREIADAKKEAEEQAKKEAEEQARREAEVKNTYRIKLADSEIITFTKDNLVEAMKDWVGENGMPTHYLQIKGIYYDNKPIFEELSGEENELQGTEDDGKFAIKTLNGSSFNGQLIQNDLIAFDENTGEERAKREGEERARREAEERASREAEARNENEYKDEILTLLRQLNPNNNTNNHYGNTSTNDSGNISTTLHDDTTEKTLSDLKSLLNEHKIRVINEYLNQETNNNLSEEIIYDEFIIKFLQNKSKSVNFRINALNLSGLVVENHQDEIEKLELINYRVNTLLYDISKNTIDNYFKENSPDIYNGIYYIINECVKNEELLAYWEGKTQALPPESDLKKKMSEKINMVKIDKFLKRLETTSTEIDSTDIEAMCLQNTFLGGYFKASTSHLEFEQEKKGVIDKILERINPEKSDQPPAPHPASASTGNPPQTPTPPL